MKSKEPMHVDCVSYIKKCIYKVRDYLVPRLFLNSNCFSVFFFSLPSYSKINNTHYNNNNEEPGSH